jgi:tetratricopeptide (TPR) repeat protein
LETKDKSLDLAQEMRRSGRPAEAIRICRKLLRRKPTHHRAMALLAQSELESGHPDQTFEVAMRLTRLRPEVVGYWNLLGRSSLMIGKGDDALAAQKRATEVDPLDAWAWAQLGLAHKMLDQDDPAFEALAKAHALAPDISTIRYNYALTLIDRKDGEEAERVCREALDREPHAADFEYLLGMSLITQEKEHAAVRVLRDAAARHPKHQGIRATFGSALAMAGEGNRATHELREALRLDPSDLTSRDNLVKVLSKSGSTDEALSELEQLDTIRGPRDETALQRAMLLVKRGDYAEACTIADRFLDDPKNRLVALDVLAQAAPRIERTDEVIDRIEAFLAQADYDALDETAKEQLNILEFLLGRLLDGRGDYATAFIAIERANLHQRRPYDRDEEERLYARLTRTYSTSSVSRLPSAKTRNSLPIFIVGMPRSGTSLLEQMLDCHPEVHGAGELSAVPNLIKELELETGHSYPDCAGDVSSGFLESLAIRHLDYLRQLGQGAKHVVDKLPSNFANLGAIAQLLPAARVIHCRRTPQASALSIYFQNFFSLRHPYANDLGDIGFKYRLHTDLMTHWREALPLQIMEVDYENLVAEPETTTRELCRFLGLEWHPEMLRFDRSSRIVTTASMQQVRQKLYSSALDHWQHYADHFERFDLELQRARLN